MKRLGLLLIVFLVGLLSACSTGSTSLIDKFSTGKVEVSFNVNVDKQLETPDTKAMIDFLRSGFVVSGEFQGNEGEFVVNAADPSKLNVKVKGMEDVKGVFPIKIRVTETDVYVKPSNESAYTKMPITESNLTTTKEQKEIEDLVINVLESFNYKFKNESTLKDQNITFGGTSESLDLNVTQLDYDELRSFTIAFIEHIAKNEEILTLIEKAQTDYNLELNKYCGSSLDCKNNTKADIKKELISVSDNLSNLDKSTIEELLGLKFDLTITVKEGNNKLGIPVYKNYDVKLDLSNNGAVLNNTLGMTSKVWDLGQPVSLTPVSDIKYVEMENPFTKSEGKFYLGHNVLERNGIEFEIDAAPFSHKGNTMLPVRYVADISNAELNWDGKLNKVDYELNGQKVSITVGNSKAMVNGKVVNLPTPAIQKDGRVYVPVRFVAENLGGNVLWNAKERSVTVTFK